MQSYETYTKYRYHFKKFAQSRKIQTINLKEAKIAKYRG